MNFGAISRLKRPLKIRFYKVDEFPITFDCLTKELNCIGMCNQCPLYLHYGKINCKEEIYKFIKEKVDLPDGYRVKGDYPKVIDCILEL